MPRKRKYVYGLLMQVHRDTNTRPEDMRQKKLVKKLEKNNSELTYDDFEPSDVQLEMRATVFRSMCQRMPRLLNSGGRQQQDWREMSRH